MSCDHIQPPDGFDTCNVYHGGAQTAHLVELDEHGSNGGRPTVCGLTRFDKRDPDTYAVIRPADLPGWGMGGSGVYGPGIEQRKCEACWQEAS